MHQHPGTGIDHLGCQRPGYGSRACGAATAHDARAGQASQGIVSPFVIGADGYHYDIKTTMEEATPKGFGRQMIWSDDFKLQAAWYLALCKYALGVRPKGFRFIVVEKEAPFLTAVFELHADLIAEGETLMLQALKSYEACKSFNEWPSYSSEVQVIARPASTAQAAPINFA